MAARFVIFFRRILCFLMVIAFTPAGFALEIDLKEQVNKLTNARTQKNILQTHPQAKVLVFFAYMGGCPILEKYVFDLKKIKNKYGDQVIIINLDSSLHAKDELQDTLKHLDNTKNPLPLVIDKKSEIAKFLQLKTSSQVAVIDLQDYKMKYRGAIDDRITLSFEKKTAQAHYLMDTIDSLLAKKNVVFTETEAFGCEINLNQKK